MSLSNKSRDMIFAGLAGVFVLSVIFIGDISNNQENNIGYAINLYQNFSPSINSFSSPNLLNFSTADNSRPVGFGISDDAVYKTAYVSINGTSWQPITLTGTILSGNWLQKDSTGTYNIQRTNIPNGTGTDNYLIIYSCTKNITGSSTAWDCHNNKWQIKTFNTTKRDATTTNNTNTTGNTSTMTWSSELLKNGGFETGDLTGWTQVNGVYGRGWEVANHILDEVVYALPQSGNYLAYCDGASNSNLGVDFYVYQDVDITPYSSYIDSGKAVVNASGWGTSSEYNPYGTDNTRIKIILLNSSKGIILTAADSLDTYVNNDVWWPKAISNYAIPSGTRYIRMWATSYEDFNGSFYDSGSIDSFSVKVGYGGNITQPPSANCTSRSYSQCDSSTDDIYWFNSCNVKEDVKTYCNSTQTCSNNACVNNVVNPYCGDTYCNNGETCTSCPSDCGTCQPQSYSGTVYYVSNVGSDSNTGLSESTPWQTLTRVNSQTLKPGDAVLFRRGDTWYGYLNTIYSGSSSAPITYSAYGSSSNAKPVITGFTNVTGWTNEGSGIYSKSVSTQSMLNIVSVDGVNTPMGRWPDTGWLIIDSFSGQTSITDSDLSNSPYNWAGAELVQRPYWWVTDRDKITSMSGNTIYYTASSDYNAMAGNGYFIQNHKGTFSKFGDWSYDGSKLYMYFGTSDNPNNHVVKIPTLDEGAYVHLKNYVKFDNLHLTGFNDFAINAHDASYVTLTNCVIDFIGNIGFKSQGWETSDHADIEYNIFDNINDDGIHFNGNSVHETIRYNTITNIGMISGLSGSGDGSGIGIESMGDNSLINHNTLRNIGYNGITWGGANTIVSNNVISYFCSNKDDGAGIYSFEDSNTGKQVINNIVMNGVGAAAGTALPNEMRAHGIYVDGADNIVISGNTIFNNYGAGIFINTQALNMNIHDNTVFNNADTGILIISNMGGKGSIRNMNMQNNIFFAKDSSQRVLHFVTTLGDSDVTQIGTLDNNYYTRPINEAGCIKSEINAWSGPSTLRTLASWQSYSGLDANSKKSPVTVTSSSDIISYYNDQDSDKNIVLPTGNYVDVTSKAYSGTITLAPWKSIVLIKKS